MKLGTQTNSVVNHLQARAVIGQPKPVVGMGATELLWSDRHAATIVEVIEEKGVVKRIATTQDDAKVVKGSGHDGSAEYEYTSRPDGARSYWRTGKDGFWKAIRLNEETGRWVNTNGRGLRIGAREEYRDPSF